MGRESYADSDDEEEGGARLRQLNTVYRSLGVGAGTFSAITSFAYLSFIYRRTGSAFPPLTRTI